MSKTLLLSDESINAYGYRVLTSGIDLSSFKKNPVMLFNHSRGGFFDDSQYNGPIGRWDDLKVEDGKLLGTAVIDADDPKGSILSKKLENNFIRSASIGFKILKTSTDEKDLVKGQTRPTITKCELVEVSLVDIPANKNAVALYDESGKLIKLAEEGMEQLNAFLPPISEKLNTLSDMKKLTLKAGWLSLLGFLKLTAPAEGETVEAEISEEQLADLNSKLEQLSTITAERDSLKTKLTEAETNVQTATELSAKIATGLEAALAKAKIDATLKGTEAIEALANKVEEFGKLSGKFPEENGDDSELETEAAEFLTETDKNVAEMRKNLGLNETKND